MEQDDVAELRLTAIHDPHPDFLPVQHDLGPIHHEVSAYDLFQRLPDHRGHVTDDDVLLQCVFTVDAHGHPREGIPFGRILAHRLVPLTVAEALYDGHLPSAVEAAVGDDGAGTEAAGWR